MFCIAKFSLGDPPTLLNFGTNPVAAVNIPITAFTAVSIAIGKW